MMESVMTAVALGAIAGAGALLAKIGRAHGEWRLRQGLHGAATATDGPGISVLCSGVRQAGQLENLLATELVDYEVIAAVDAAHYPACFEALVSRYRMIRVEFAPSEEFPAREVRSMWRSRKRCFRRLVLLDRESTTPAEDFDAAASVAAYDWLLPVRRGELLLPGAVERLAERLGERQPGDVDIVCPRVGEPCAAVRREAVAAAGGFGGRIRRCVARSKRLMLWEPLLYRPGVPGKGLPRRLRWPASALLAGGIAAAAISGRWAVAALLLAAATVWCVAALATMWTTEMAGLKGRDAEESGIRCKFGMKNFLLS